MKVYVLSRGEDHEGSYIVGVFASKEDAVAKAAQMPTHYEGGWEPLRDNFWGNGCDYLLIEEWKVQ